MSDLAEMKREIHHFDIENAEQKEAWLDMRVGDLTSTDISALFGQNPYRTKYEVWQEKAFKKKNEISVSERMKWGSRFESTIAKGVAEDQGWNIRAWNAYQRIPELRLGSSFDYRILQGEGQPKTVFEIKCIDFWVFRKFWEERHDGSLEAPPHIEWQVQQEMLCSGYAECKLAAMVGGNNVQLVHFVADENMQAAIVSESVKFWQSIEDGDEPAPEYARDLKNLASRYNYTNPNFYADPVGIERLTILANAHADRKERAKVYDADFETIKCEVLDILKDCEGADLPGFKKFTCKASRKGVRSLLVTREPEEDGTDG